MSRGITAHIQNIWTELKAIRAATSKRFESVDDKIAVLERRLDRLDTTPENQQKERAKTRVPKLERPPVMVAAGAGSDPEDN